jgi:hypothetical protein
VESINVVCERYPEIRRTAHQHPLAHRATTPTRKGFFLCCRTCHASIERNRTNDYQPNAPPGQHRATAATQEAAELFTDHRTQDKNKNCLLWVGIHLSLTKQPLMCVQHTRSDRVKIFTQQHVGGSRREGSAGCAGDDERVTQIPPPIAEEERSDTEEGKAQRQKILMIKHTLYPHSHGPLQPARCTSTRSRHIDSPPGPWLRTPPLLTPAHTSARWSPFSLSHTCVLSLVLELCERS